MDVIESDIYALRIDLIVEEERIIDIEEIKDLIEIEMIENMTDMIDMKDMNIIIIVRKSKDNIFTLK